MKRQIAFSLCLLSVAGCLENPLTRGNNTNNSEHMVDEEYVLRVENTSNDDLVWDSCLLASPLLVTSLGKEYVLAFTLADGVHAVDPETLTVEWSVDLPTLPDHVVNLIATPVVVDTNVFVAYQLVEDGDRQEHRVVAIDLETRALSTAFESVTLYAEKPSFDGDDTVVFSPKNSLSRATLAFGSTDEKPEGFVYVSYGNRQDIQPWHGWVYELDLAAWRSGDEPVSSVLLTTPETFCPVEGRSGSADMICGGGVWAPSGPVVIPQASGFEMIVPTGNGQLDLNRNDYANTLMRLSPGLDFDPECDAELCADFDTIAPSEACMASCKNLFIPRLKEGDPELRPANGKCDGKTFLECYALLDYDLGANSPAPLTLDSGMEVFVLPAKDGSVYLVDQNHMGTMLDREIVVDVCGTVDDSCKRNWAGMMVTEPEIVMVDGLPVAIIPTFMSDRSHPAGLVALAIRDDQPSPELELLWQAPDFDTSEAVERFRDHPSRTVVTSFPERDLAIVWVIDVVPTAKGIGTMLGVDVATGDVLFRHPLMGQGRRYVEPLFTNNRVFATSCNSSKGPGRLEVVDFEFELIEVDSP